MFIIIRMEVQSKNCRMLLLFLEKQRCKTVQVVSPVGPDVTAIGLEEDMIKTAFGQCLVECDRALPEEIIGTASQEIEPDSGLFKSIDLLDSGIAGSRERAYPVKHLRIEIGRCDSVAAAH